MDLGEYLKNVQIMTLSNNGPVIACPVTVNYIEMAYNFIENLKKFSLDKNIYFQCLDEQVYKELSSVVYCEKKTDIIKKVKNRGDWIEAEKYSKIPLVRYLLGTFKRDLLLSDIDIFYFKNPLPLFYKYREDYDIVSSSDKPYFPFNMIRKRDRIVTCVPLPKDYGITDQKKYGYMNGAVALYKYQEKIIQKFDEIFTLELLKSYPKRKEAGAAQTIYNTNIQRTGLTVKKLSVFEIANGSLLKVDYLKKKVLEEATALHYNFFDPDPYIGYKQKIENMRSNEHWLINK